MRFDRMLRRTTFLLACVALVAAGIGIVASSAELSSRELQQVSLADELARLRAVLDDPSRTFELWNQIKPGSAAALADAEQALAAGRRTLALERIVAARNQLAAAAYTGDRLATAGQDLSSLEAEWKRLGSSLRADLAAPAVASLATVRPAILRALAETAVSQARVYHDASLEYGRNTMPESGLFYLGAAQAQRDWVTTARDWSGSLAVGPPPARALGPEIDALQSVLLAAYRPPASIERHREFITASATLKEARELDAAGLRFGALLRFLQATSRVAQLKSMTAAQPDAATIRERLREVEARITAAPVDHSVARLFVEQAQAALDRAGDAAVPPAAAAAVSDVLPAYFAALGPVGPSAAKTAPTVRVTLVRWPYT